LAEQNQPSCLEVVSELLSRCETESTVFPPTDLYNEGWLLRIILDWFSKQDTADHELSFSYRCKWFSEARLPTQFKATSRKDPLYETWTHADGVIGHIIVGGFGKTDTSLAGDATHLRLVPEASEQSGHSTEGRKAGPGIPRRKGPMVRGLVPADLGGVGNQQLELGIHSGLYRYH
jgi:hypothetical protein